MNTKLLNIKAKLTPEDAGGGAITELRNLSITSLHFLMDGFPNHEEFPVDDSDCMYLIKAVKAMR